MQHPLADALSPHEQAKLPLAKRFTVDDVASPEAVHAGDLLMYGWGENGRLGLGDEDDRATPALVARAVFDDDAVLMVACGWEHTAVATEGGGVYTFRRGLFGQLGHGDENLH